MLKLDIYEYFDWKKMCITQKSQNVQKNQITDKRVKLGAQI